MKRNLFFTNDGHLVPSTTDIFQNNDGHYYASLVRECGNCSDSGQTDDSVCGKCGGSSVVGPVTERLSVINDVSFFENIDLLHANPTLEAWKNKHKEILTVVENANTKFSNNIITQLEKSGF